MCLSHITLTNFYFQQVLQAQLSAAADKAGESSALSKLAQSHAQELSSRDQELARLREALQKQQGALSARHAAHSTELDQLEAKLQQSVRGHVV